MPRQPFLNICNLDTPYTVGPGVINNRPEQASLIGQCIAMWSDIELQMALSLGAILKTSSDAAVALFLSIKTSRTQREALETIARLLLVGNALDAFEALMSVYGSLEKQRNALAHGLYGVSDALPDAVLWCDIQDHANFLINVYLSEYKGTPLVDPHEKLRRDMYVYRSQDLKELLRDLTELQKAASLFHCYHQPRDPKPSESSLIEMLSLRLIKQALQVIRQHGDRKAMP
jgi:hypothetical protein